MTNAELLEMIWKYGAAQQELGELGITPTTEKSVKLYKKQRDLCIKMEAHFETAFPVET